VAKTVPLDAPTLAWAKGAFARYYRSARIDPPERLNRREFAAFPFALETFMRRHAALRTPAEFHRFLADEVPRHVYYSSAYYRRPAESTMSAKEWLGADLVFDLDSDHLRGAAALDYAGQLALVKRRLRTLLDDFLFGDFGIDPAATALVFSGGRGYHVHVRAEGFTSLASPERRELVDYVLGTGVDAMRAVGTQRQTSELSTAEGSGPDDLPTPRGGRGAPRAHYLVPPDTPGWPGRTTRAVLEVLNRWEAAGRDAAAKEMVGYGLPPAKARRWAKLLVEEGGGERIRTHLTLEVFPKEVPPEFLEAIVPRAAIEVQGETDAPVTTDIHRLIRLPGSIHGGTGFRAVPLSRDDLDAFDPFRDALLGSGDAERTDVTFAEKVRYPFPGNELHGTAGATDSLPTPVALFLVLRGEAALRPSPAG
jgi:DNA primase small subunit